jgi:hypothetical protein
MAALRCIALIIQYAAGDVDETIGEMPAIRLCGS